MATPALDLLAARALSGGRPEITARDVATFTKSPFALWCETFAPPEARDPLDDFLRMLLDQGRDHEARILRERYADAAPLAGRTEEARFRAALTAMSEGAASIAGAPLFWLPEGLHGRADVLERRDDAPSAFGPWHYVVKEIKLAKNVREHHAIQAALYHRILGHLQGYVPPTFSLIGRDGDETTFAYDEPALLATLRAVRAIRAGEVEPECAYDEVEWPWTTYANERAERARDASLVSGVGAATRAKLATAGIRTVEALAAADPAALTALRGIGDKKARQLRTSAAALAAGTHLPLGAPTFRAARTEVFLDLEGTGAQLSDEGLVEMDYLIGALHRPCAGAEGRGAGAEGTYVSFLADTLEAEGDMWRAFLQWFERLDDPVLYAWSAYEKTHLRRLGERHGIPPALKTRLDAALVDLLPIARDAFAFPTYGNSIKRIAPYCGFQWRHKGVGAMTSIAHYFAYVADPAAARDRLQLVLDYNEDDCIAMRVVKDWVAAHA